MKLLEHIKIGSKSAANRIMMPPLVIFGTGTSNGEIGDYRMRHYEQRAKDGVGTIVVEATAVQKDYLITESQIGVWSDGHVPGLKDLASRIHKYPVISVVQLQHSGGRGKPAQGKGIPFGPSSGEFDKGIMREATIEELESVCVSFAEAALRIQEAGFDGVEIHNAHGYLLTQMVSPLINKRSDKYGGELENRMKLSIDILSGIRKACGQNFIIGVRLGANEPTYDDGIKIAQIFEKNGVDYLSVSSGHGDTSVLPAVPPDFPYNSVVYGGALVKRETDGVPVVLVNNINTAERGEWLLQNGYADMVAYGRPILATPDFVARAKTEPKNNSDCKGCKRCLWFTDYRKCPVLR